MREAVGRVSGVQKDGRYGRCCWWSDENGGRLDRRGCYSLFSSFFLFFFLPGAGRREAVGKQRDKECQQGVQCERERR